MKSKTKSRMTPEQIKAVTTLHFPNAERLRIKELTDGMFNAAYLIEGSGVLEKGVVLKVGPESTVEILTYEQDILRTEVKVYNLLKDKPIPTPIVYAYDFTHKHIPCDYFFMEKLDGQTWKSCGRKIKKGDRPALMRDLGRCNAAVHSVEGNWFGYIKDDKRFHFDSWGKAFTSMMNDILNDGRMRGDKLPYAEIDNILKSHRSLLDAVTVPKLVDFDMWAGNVFLKKNGAFHITGVVDFERCFFGDPYADFTSAMMLFSDVEKEQDFCTGYSEISGLPVTIGEDDRVRMNLYRLYMAVIMMVETYRYNKAYAMMAKSYFKGQINKLIQKL
ncbi:Fructosamine-3-kinase [Evansella caseinilytica]|uniref:Fructosamine-3-kinase n=1 Tax=Evansella caseinilytica TaxID=1503961 RepID=A0A1H3HZH5_9BACI|nr:aminoglycoside phosphotransferase family protein [Evansella caseinilytica]SDY20843.1 Fructosamine-3-kinase [Evansella caseinilytica]